MWNTVMYSVADKSFGTLYTLSIGIWWDAISIYKQIFTYSYYWQEA
jgi:hypothetical protein